MTTPEPASAADLKASRAYTISQPRKRLTVVSRLAKGLWDGQSLSEWLLEKADLEREAASANKDDRTRIDHPYNMARVKEFKALNAVHSACIDAKVACTTGIGFVTPEQKEKRRREETPPEVDMTTGLEKPNPIPDEMKDMPSRADEVLDPLCEISFQNVIDEVCEDFWCGWGFMETVRERSGLVKAIYHIPAESMWIVREKDGLNWHFILLGSDGKERRVARWGDAEGLEQRLKSGSAQDDSFVSEDEDDEVEGKTDSEHVSEVLYFPRPSSRDRYYGTADFLSAVQYVELQQAVDQKVFDFFNNRGVPDLAVFITGANVPDEDLQQIEDAFLATIGGGNSHKTIVANLAGTETKVDLHKLAMETNAQDEFGDTTTALGLQIVDAHGVPPLLAGIQIPGKMGATNELPNSLLAFQTLKIGPAQRVFAAVLRRTLGSPEAGLGLSPQDFVFNKITDVFDIGASDTMARMRTPIVKAQAEGRSPKEGLKD